MMKPLAAVCMLAEALLCMIIIHRWGWAAMGVSAALSVLVGTRQYMQRKPVRP